MSTYLVIKKSDSLQTYTALSEKPSKPYIRTKDGYFPLTTETSNSGIFVKRSDNTYRIAKSIPGIAHVSDYANTTTIAQGLLEQSSYSRSNKVRTRNSLLNNSIEVLASSSKININDTSCNVTLTISKPTIIDKLVYGLSNQHDYLAPNIDISQSHKYSIAFGVYSTVYHPTDPRLDSGGLCWSGIALADFADDEYMTTSSSFTYNGRLHFHIYARYDVMCPNMFAQNPTDDTYIGCNNYWDYVRLYTNASAVHNDYTVSTSHYLPNNVKNISNYSYLSFAALREDGYSRDGSYTMNPWLYNIDAYIYDEAITSKKFVTNEYIWNVLNQPNQTDVASYYSSISYYNSTTYNTTTYAYVETGTVNSATYIYYDEVITETLQSQRLETIINNVTSQSDTIITATASSKTVGVIFDRSQTFQATKLYGDMGGTFSTNLVVSSQQINENSYQYTLTAHITNSARTWYMSQTDAIPSTGTYFKAFYADRDVLNSFGTNPRKPVFNGSATYVVWTPYQDVASMSHTVPIDDFSTSLSLSFGASTSATRMSLYCRYGLRDGDELNLDFINTDTIVGDMYYYQELTKTSSTRSDAKTQTYHGYEICFSKISKDGSGNSTSISNNTASYTYDYYKHKSYPGLASIKFKGFTNTTAATMMAYGVKADGITNGITSFNTSTSKLSYTLFNQNSLSGSASLYTTNNSGTMEVTMNTNTTTQVNTTQESVETIYDTYTATRGI